MDASTSNQDKMSERDWESTSAGASTSYVKYEKPSTPAPNPDKKKMEVQFTYLCTYLFR